MGRGYQNIPPRMCLGIMKILRTRAFSLKDKFREFNQKLDDKLMKAIVKDEKTLDDTIHQYKEMLKDESLSEKDKKQLKGLLVTAKRVKKTFSNKAQKAIRRVVEEEG